MNLKHLQTEYTKKRHISTVLFPLLVASQLNNKTASFLLPQHISSPPYVLVLDQKLHESLADLSFYVGRLCLSYAMMLEWIASELHLNTLRALVGDEEEQKKCSLPHKLQTLFSSFKFQLCWSNKIQIVFLLRLSCQFETETNMVFILDVKTEFLFISTSIMHSFIISMFWFYGWMRFMYSSSFSVYIPSKHVKI